MFVSVFSLVSHCAEVTGRTFLSMLGQHVPKHLFSPLLKCSSFFSNCKIKNIVSVLCPQLLFHFCHLFLVFVILITVRLINIFRLLRGLLCCYVQQPFIAINTCNSLGQSWQCFKTYWVCCAIVHCYCLHSAGCWCPTRLQNYCSC